MSNDSVFLCTICKQRAYDHRKSKVFCPDCALLMVYPRTICSGCSMVISDPAFFGMGGDYCRDCLGMSGAFGFIDR